jgi:ABC-2 type transport system permease protein
MTTMELSAQPGLVAREHAPLGRLLASELRWIYRRPRTLVALGLLALTPIAIGVGASFAGQQVDAGGGSGPAGAGDGDGALFSSLVGNGLALPIIAFALTMVMLLPLLGAMTSADAIAGESGHGTLRGLLIAPVGRLRLLLVKAFGVATVTLTACLLIALVGAVSGLIMLGSGGLITLSGTTLSVGDAVVRVALAALWVTFQIWGVAAVALAVSTFTDHPLVVLAVTVGMVVVFTVLSFISTLDWLHPYLLTNDWQLALTGFLRDPVAATDLWNGIGRAACYIAIGLSVAAGKMVTKDG